MRENNLIFDSLKQTEEKMNEMNRLNIPVGYVEVSLSTNGMLGAPKSFHVRNFKVKDVLALSLSEQVDLPNRLVKVLNDMILEDVDVATWHEKEIEELMVYIYMTFFNGTIKDVDFEVTEEDRKWLIDNNMSDLLCDLNNGKWKPKTDINIPTGVETYDIPNDFDPNITITNKKTGFYCTFSFVKYGDQLLIKRWLDSYYASKEKQFEKLKRNIDFNNSLIFKAQDNPSLLEKTIEIDPKEQEDYEEYINERFQTLTDIVKIISIVNYNGVDVSNMSVGEKYELLSQDARIDIGMINKLTKKQNKFRFGIKPEVKMVNPITKGVVSRPFSFRLPVILSAFQLSGDDDYDDGDDDED